MPHAVLPNGVDLAYEVHGDASRPVVFIILGITDNITDWPVGLYEPLVSNGYCVVRYELRDSGLSTKFDACGPADLKAAKQQFDAGRRPAAPYTAQDIATDARLLLEHLRIRSACVVGYSFGAMVAQALALLAPDMVSALVCLQGSNYNPALPPRSPGVEAAMHGATREYETAEEKIQAIFNLRIATNGSRHALDADEARDSAETSVARMYCPQGTGRILLSRLASEPIHQETCGIECPALILHGDEDQIFSIEHGADMAARIPDAHLSVLQGAGHNHPLSLQPLIADHLLKFVSSREI
jgi:pimeloyl-ACP methyl ester carboxylesterase